MDYFRKYEIGGQSCRGCPYLYQSNVFSSCLAEKEVGDFRSAEIKYSTRPDWCPVQLRQQTHQFVELPKDPILADLLEERGYTEAAKALREKL